MRIALIGYGKMGKEIEKIALDRGHQIVLKIDITNPEDLTIGNLQTADVAIEFTIPSLAVSNYQLCFEAGIPVVSGTTGWLDRQAEVYENCKKLDGTFFYASNYSLGVNIFFSLNKKLAALMASHSDYKVAMTEIHHTHKLDAPSGTAITLAEGIIKNIPSKTNWVNQPTSDSAELEIISERIAEVPGTHTIRYESEVDYIEITHCAKTAQDLLWGPCWPLSFLMEKREF